MEIALFLQYADIFKLSNQYIDISLLKHFKNISGEKGEGFVGTIIKDTWTIRGVEMRGRWGGLRVRVGRGEKAENCT